MTALLKNIFPNEKKNAHELNIYSQKVLKLQSDQSPKAKQLSNRNTCL